MRDDARYWARAYAAADHVLSVERDKGKEATASLPGQELAMAEAYFRLALDRREASRIFLRSADRPDARHGDKTPKGKG